MRIFYMGNNWVGLQLLRYLNEQRAQIVGIGVHPSGRQKYRKEILECCTAAPPQVFDASTLHQPAVLNSIRGLSPDMGICGCFGYILRKELINIFPLGCINCHISYLPYNRGAFPNVWSIVERTPAGVSLHYVDEGVDTGDIIAQQRVQVGPTDTGQSVYQKLEYAAVQLFSETWPAIRDGVPSRTKQDDATATSHRLADVEKIDEICLDRAYVARDLIDVLRARTFPPHRGAYFTENGRKIFIRLQLLDENGTDNE